MRVLIYDAANDLFGKKMSNGAVARDQEAEGLLLEDMITTAEVGQRRVFTSDMSNRYMSPC